MNYNRNISMRRYVATQYLSYLLVYRKVSSIEYIDAVTIDIEMHTDAQAPSTPYTQAHMPTNIYRVRERNEEREGERNIKNVTTMRSSLKIYSNRYNV